MQELLSFRRHSLPNGLRVLLLEDHALPIVSLQVHFLAGSRNERPGITGISHLFEHMMFRGTKRLAPEEFSKIIQARGGVVNAFTTQDHTTYWENFPAEELPIVVELEAHRLKELLLTEESLKTEREVVRSERKMRIATTPYGAAVEELYALAYLRHPYRWPIIGWDYDLKRMTLEDCLRYFRERYAPNNAVIVAAGDLDPEKTLELIQRHYGALEPQRLPSDPIEPEPPQRGPRTAVFKKAVELEAFFWGFHVPGIESEEIYPLLGLSYILSQGRSSRFWQRFVREGKATDLRVVVDPPPFWPMDPALLVIYGIVAPGNSSEGLQEEVQRELDDLGEKGPKLWEVEKAKNCLLTDLYRSLEGLFYRGLMGGIYELKTGSFERAWGVADGYKSITPEAIRAVVRKYLHEDNRTCVVVKPVSMEEHEKLGLLE